MALAAGTRLGPDEIVAPLGAGGMGEVYKARDTRLDRTVAIKVLPALLADDPQFRERFEREARAISALDHPHICALYDVGHEPSTKTDFLVMQYLEGETLAERLPRGAMPVDQALQYAIEIADALDKAHHHGIVHRDLKPGNVMLARIGRAAATHAKLLDFGLAKAVSSPACLRERSTGRRRPLFCRTPMAPCIRRRATCSSRATIPCSRGVRCRQSQAHRRADDGSARRW